MAPAPQRLTNDFLKDIIKRAIDHEISISDDEIIAYISKKRNNQIKSKTWITYVELKITEEPELKEIVRKHMETLLGVTDDEVKKLKEHNFETLTDMVNLFYGSFDSANLNHRIIFSLANEKTMRQKELDYARNRKELPTSSRVVATRRSRTSARAARQVAPTCEETKFRLFFSLPPRLS